MTATKYVNPEMSDREMIQAIASAIVARKAASETPVQFIDVLRDDSGREVLKPVRVVDRRIPAILDRCAKEDGQSYETIPVLIDEEKYKMTTTFFDWRKVSVDSVTSAFYNSGLADDVFVKIDDALNENENYNSNDLPELEKVLIDIIEFALDVKNHQYYDDLKVKIDRKTPFHYVTNDRKLFLLKVYEERSRYCRLGIPFIVCATIDGIQRNVAFNSHGNCIGCYPAIPDNGEEFYLIVYKCLNDAEVIEWAKRKGIYGIGEFPFED